MMHQHDMYYECCEDLPRADIAWAISIFKLKCQGGGTADGGTA